MGLLDLAKGFGAPFGVAENMLDSGYITVSTYRLLLYSLRSHKGQSSKRLLTTRSSARLAFRVVRGVFPRSFPGVLNSSATCLKDQNIS